MGNFQLSVIIPVYNGERTLEQTLQSIIGQHTNVEIILIDQASDDGSRAIAATFTNQLNLKIVDAPQNVNWMQNTNLGLSLASNPFVTFLHQDDYWMPGRVDELARMAEKYPTAHLWLHSAWYVDPKGKKIGTFAPRFGRKQRLIPSLEATARLLVQNTFALPAVMFRLDDAKDLGGLDETLWYTADWDFWLRLARLGPVAWVPERLAAFRIHHNSLTMTGSKNMESFRAQLDTPIDHHIGALPDKQAARVKKIAQASNALNVYLASAYHKQRSGFASVLYRIFHLGPLGWYIFLRDTNIFARLIPRIRVFTGKKGQK